MILVGVNQDVQNDSDSGIKPGAVAAVVIGSLAASLLLLCLVLKRRSRRTVVSNFKDVDKSDDDSLKDVESETYYSREVQIVGESGSTSSDSSGWTGKKQDESLASGFEFPRFLKVRTEREEAPTTGSVAPSLGTALPLSNEHNCSSATCKICEERRNNGIVFIRTGTMMTPGTRSTADVSL